MSATQVSRWCFTSYKTEMNIDKTHCKYYIYQRELNPETKNQHFQGFLILKRSQRRKKVKEIINDEKAHLEVCNGSDEDNIKYCSKTESRLTEPVEFGDRPKTVQGKRSDLESFKDYMKNNTNKKIEYSEILDKFAGICAKYPKFVKELAVQYKKRIIKEEEKREEMTNIHIIYGETNTGKTTYVKTFKDTYWKDENTIWWDGYDGHEICIFNEWTNKGKYTALELLKLSDHAPYSLQIKGSTGQFLAKNIWITTNLTPDEVTEDLESAHKKAFLRRTSWYIMVNYKLTKVTL